MRLHDAQSGLKPNSKAFKLPTNANHDLGVFLLFLSLVSYFVVPLLAPGFGYSSAKASVFSTPIGAALTLAGFILLFFARKVVRVEQNKLTIKDGFLASPLVFTYTATPTIKLSSYEDTHEKRTTEVWTVYLIDEERQYLIDRRIGHQIWARALSEYLAKSTGASLIEVIEGISQEFKCTELDNSLVERIKKYPALLGRPVTEPTPRPASYRRDARSMSLEWSLFKTGLLMEVLMIATLLASLAFIPIPGGRDQKSISLYQVASISQDYRYFSSVAAFTLLSLIILGGYKTRLELDTTKGALAKASVWGIPVKNAEISLDKLEQIGASITSRGPYILLVSDKKIIKELVSSSERARWIAWEMRSLLASTEAAGKLASDVDTTA